MVFSTRTLLFASLAYSSLAAPPGEAYAGAPIVNPRQAVEFGATALNFTAGVLLKAHATPSGRSPRSDAAFLRKLGAELSVQYDEKGHDTEHVAESALALGTDALKLGAELLSNTSPSSAGSRTVSRRASSHEKPWMPDADSHRKLGARNAPAGVALAGSQSLHKRAHQGAPSAAQHVGSKSSSHAAAADHKTFNDVVKGAVRQDTGGGSLALGHVRSQASLRSMDDLPMGGGFLGGIGGSSPFGGSAVLAATMRAAPAVARPAADERPHFHAVTSGERDRARGGAAGLV